MTTQAPQWPPHPRYADPESDADLQAAVDSATALLHVDSARQYGLITGGPTVNVERCKEIIALGERRGIVPSPGCVERFVADFNAGRPVPS